MCSRCGNIEAQFRDKEAKEQHEHFFAGPEPKRSEDGKHATFAKATFENMSMMWGNAKQWAPSE